MARELNFTNGIDVIKYQDSTNHLDLSLTDDGVPFDLSQLDSLTLRIANANGYVMSKQVDLSTISDPQSGEVSIHLDEDTMTKLVPDDYNIEVWVEINPVSITPQANSVNVTVSDKGLDPVQSIFPSDGNLSFTIDDNIKSSPTNTINAYVVDDVWDDIQKWKTDTANSISTTLSSQLLNEITHWQGDISDSLKKDLLQALMNDESAIQKQLNDILTQSLDELINKEVSDAKSDISKQLNDAMIADVSQQIANLKPQVTSDLHNQLTSELSTELSSAIQQWENSTDNDLNNKLAQAIVQKTNDMQGTLSTQLTNYLAGQLSNYEQNATNTITTNITNQVTQSISNLFSQEDSSLRADLEGLVKGTIQNDVTNTLQQMQQNGDIYATKQQFTDFKNGVNDLIAKLNIASDITRQLSTINNTLAEIPTIQSNITNLQSSVSSNATSIAANSSNISSLQSSTAAMSSATSASFNNVQSSLSTLGSTQNSQSSQINNLQSNAVQYVRSLSSSDDFNSLTSNGVYSFSGAAPSNAPVSTQLSGTTYAGQATVINEGGFTSQNVELASGENFTREIPGSNIPTVQGNYVAGLVSGAGSTIQTASPSQAYTTNQYTFTPSAQLSSLTGNSVVLVGGVINGWPYNNCAPITTKDLSVLASGNGNFSNQSYYGTSPAYSNMSFVVDIPVTTILNNQNGYTTYALTRTNGGSAISFDHLIVSQITISYSSANNTVTVTTSTGTVYDGPAWMSVNTFDNSILNGMSNMISFTHNTQVTPALAPLNSLTANIQTTMSVPSPWIRTANMNDVNNVQTSLNTVAAQLQSSITLASSQISALQGNSVQGGTALTSGTDFNTVMSNGVYALSYLPSTSFPNAFYPGNGIDLIVFSSAGYVVQEVISNDSNSNPQINYRISCNNWWSRWIKIATIDDVYNTALVFRGDTAPGANGGNAALSDNTLSGIYNLAGRQYTDLPPTYGSHAWGQLVVMNTGGVCTQRIIDNGSGSYIRSINSWGFSPWNRLQN